MKALRFYEFGEPTHVLHVEEVQEPSPGPGEVLVKIHAASINPADVKNVEGKFPQTRPPRTPGRDLAGVIVAGDREMAGREVWASGGDLGFTRDGCHAEYVVLPKAGARPKPKSLSMVEAASVGVNYIVAWLGLMEVAKLKEGETLLVFGATGAVGSSVIKIARNAGARIIAVDKKVPDPEKARLPGIDLALGSDGDDIPSRVLEFTSGRGVNVVYDCVGGPLFEKGLQSLAYYGRQVNIVAVGERRVTFDLQDFYRKQLSLFGVNTSLLDTVESGRILDNLRPAFEEGRLTPPHVAETCPLENAPEAYNWLDKGSVAGKIVIVFKN